MDNKDGTYKGSFKVDKDGDYLLDVDLVAGEKSERVKIKKDDGAAERQRELQEKEKARKDKEERENRERGREKEHERDKERQLQLEREQEKEREREEKEKARKEKEEREQREREKELEQEQERERDREKEKEKDGQREIERELERQRELEREKEQQERELEREHVKEIEALASTGQVDLSSLGTPNEYEEIHFTIGKKGFTLPEGVSYSARVENENGEGTQLPLNEWIAITQRNTHNWCNGQFL